MIAAGSVERGCMSAGGIQRLLLGGSLVLGLACCAYWLHVHHGMAAKYGEAIGAR
jgi:hypothetical protein